MVLSFDRLQALRDCCRDEAAFARLRQILAIERGEQETEEEECRQSEARYKARLDASPDLMFRLSLNGRYLDFKGNSSAEVSREEIVGQSLHDLLPKDVADLSLQAIRKTLASRDLQTCEYQLITPKGMRDYEARLVVSGKDEVLAIVQDVSDRKRSEVEHQQVEADLRMSEERLQSFFKATFEAVVIHDFGKILDVNPAAERLFGYSAREMIGLPVLNLAAPVSQEMVLHQWRSLNHPDQPYAYEGTGQRKDGSTFVAAVRAKAIDYRGRLVRVAGIRDITESKLAETAIRQSEAKNRALINAIPDLMFCIRQDGTYLDCKAENDSDILIPPQEIIGKTVYEVLPPNLAEQRMHYVEQALQTGENQHFEYQLRLHNSYRASQPHPKSIQDLGAVPLEAAVLRDYEARIVVSGEDEVLAIVRDITERKLSEAALRLSEEKFSKAFRSSPNPMTIATLQEGRLIEVNDSFLQVTGYTPEEVIGRKVHELNLWVTPADRDRVVQPLRQYGTVRNLECQLRTKSGEVRTSLFSAELIHISDELCMLDVAVDITDRKRSEQQLRAAAERDRILGQIALRIRESLDLDQILNTAVEEVREILQVDRVCISHYDKAGYGKIIAESHAPGFVATTGWVTDNEVCDEVKALFEQERICVISDTSQGNWSLCFNNYFSRYDIKAAIGVPIMPGGQLFGTLVAYQCSGPRDWQFSEADLLEQLATQVTIAIQQAQLYRQVQNLNAGLEQQVEERTAQLQQKMEELQDLNQLKDEFLNAFSHDLRTPMMGTSLVLKNLLNQPGETITMTRSIVERMIQSSNHQLNLINSLLQAHSSETQGVMLQYELVQLNQLIQVTVENLEPLVAKNRATLTNQVPMDLPLVTADPVQLRRVFENLLTNALHHNPPEVHIVFNATVEAEMIRFTIQDDGVGMEQEVCDRLFERYVRGPKSRHSSGIGLGLYLCRQIITAHGGQIGVKSTPNVGSTFWLTLPLAIPAIAT